MNVSSKSDQVNVLLVDDRPENLLALEAVLGDLQYNLIRAHSGEEALKWVLKEDFAVILLDVQMPGMNGFETAKIIKSRERTKDTPIIFVTAISKAPENVFTGYSVGAIDYVFKPFEPEILKTKVENFSIIHQAKKRVEFQKDELAMKTAELEQANKTLQKMTEQLRNSEMMARIIGDTSMDTMVTFQDDTRLVTVNPAIWSMFGYEAWEIEGRRIDMLIPTFKLPSPITTSKMMIRQETEAIRKDGRVFPVEIQLSRTNVDGKAIYACTIRDISDLKKHILELEHQAMHDSLTHLPNRTLLYKRLESVIHQPEQYATAALLLLDLDHFKTINDTLGHHHGDLLLKQVADRLLSLSGISHTIARLGGDEFAVLLLGKAKDEVMHFVQEMTEKIEQPYEIEGHFISMRSSIGIVFYPEHGENVEILMRRADIAMYAAKRSDRSYAVYCHESDTHTVEKLNLMNDLRRAIDNEQFELYYQPQLDMKTKKLIAAEALLRWKHPHQGFISPDRFIPIAEQNGFMSKITMWVIREALKQCREWHEKGLSIQMSVNLSASNLYDYQLVSDIESLLQEFGVAAQHLILEITESFIMADPTSALAILNELAHKGVGLSIDDFGTGYSSLAYLKKLPVHEVKVDKSFVMDMMYDNNDAIIVKTVVNLAHNLGLRVVAEGIESAEIWQQLEEWGCNTAQGYYISAPKPAADFQDWIHVSPQFLQK